MEKKRLSGTTIFAWLLIVSNIYLVCYEWWFVLVRKFFNFFTIIYWCINPIALKLEALSSVFPANSLVSYLDLCWAIALAVCGFALLKFKNPARKLIVIFSIIQVVVYLACLFSLTPLHLIGHIVVRRFLSILLSVAPAIIYIIYFTRPKVKEQFK